MFGLRIPELIIIFLIFGGFLLPFIINANLAKSRGKSVALMFLLRVFFSWIVTLILALMSKVPEQSKT